MTCSSETSVDFQRAAYRYTPEERTLHNHRCENIISYVYAYNLHDSHLNEHNG
jgi:hypothetical protein